MDVVTPLHNPPHLKQGQNREEVAFENYGIVLEVKAHLSGLKETVVSSEIVIVDCHCNCSCETIFLLHFNFVLLYLTNNISYILLL